MAGEDGAADMLPEQEAHAQLAAGKFDAVAPMLDELELQVRMKLVRVVRAVASAQAGSHNSNPLYLQSPVPGVLDQQWPVALHMLGHIFNNHL